MGEENNVQRTLDKKEVIRGKRASLPIFYDDYGFEVEKMKKVLDLFLGERRNVDDQEL